jgi:GcrA cell cycle regulator
MIGECAEMAKRRITGFDWSGKNVDRLKALLDEKLSASRIAVMLGGGVTRNAVIGKVHRLGLSLAGAHRDRMPRPAATAGRERARRPGGDSDVSRERPADEQVARVLKRAPQATGVRADLTICRRRGANCTEMKKAERGDTVCRPPAIVIEPSPPVVPKPMPIGVTIEELRDGMCRFLLRELGRRKFSYCGRTCEVSRSYCAEHHRIVYRSSKVVVHGASTAVSVGGVGSAVSFFAMACAFVLGLGAAPFCRPAQAQDASFGCKVLPGSIAVSLPSGQSSYTTAPNGASCASAQDFQNYQTQLDAYNQALNNQNGAVPQAPLLQTTSRAANPNPYYVDLNTGGSAASTSRFYFNLTPP